MTNTCQNHAHRYTSFCLTLTGALFSYLSVIRDENARTLSFPLLICLSQKVNKGTSVTVTFPDLKQNQCIEESYA